MVFSNLMGSLTYLKGRFANQQVEPLLTESLRKLSKSIEGFVDIQQKTLSINTSINSNLKLNNKNLTGIPGGIVEAFKSSLLARLVNLPVEKSFIRLSQQMKYTGQDQIKLLESMVLLRSTTGLSSKTMGMLSDHILKLGQTFHTTSTVLLEYLDGIQKSQATFAIAGLSDDINKAVISLGAVLGKTQANNLAVVVNRLLAGGEEGLRLTGLFGLQEQVNQIKQGLDVEANLIEIFNKIGNKSEILRDVSGGDTNLLKILNEQFGDEFIEAGYNLNKAFEELSPSILKQMEEAKKNTEIMDKFGVSVEAAYDNFVSFFKVIGLSIAGFIGSNQTIVNIAGAVAIAFIGLAGAATSFSLSLYTAKHATFLLKLAATQASTSLKSITLFAGRLFMGLTWAIRAISVIGMVLNLLALGWSIYDSLTSKKDNSDGKVLEDIKDNTGITAEAISKEENEKLKNSIPSYLKMTNDYINEYISDVLGRNEILAKQLGLLETIDNSMAITSQGIRTMLDREKTTLGSEGAFR